VAWRGVALHLVGIGFVFSNRGRLHSREAASSVVPRADARASERTVGFVFDLPLFNEDLPPGGGAWV
jgi:hypothetical protein